MVIDDFAGTTPGFTTPGFLAEKFLAGRLCLQLALHAGRLGIPFAIAHVTYRKV